MKKLLLIMAILLCVGSVSAWTIQGSQYTGKIEFYNGGVGTAFIDGYPPTSFMWEWKGENNYEAHYLWYSANFTYEKGIITSERFPGVKLI